MFIFVLLFCGIGAAYAQYDIDYELNDVCPLSDKKTGYCTYVDNCDYARKKLYVDKTQNGLEFCVWEGSVSIVCCPNDDQSHRTGPYSVHFESWDNDMVSNENLTCRYKGDLPLICCPKIPDYLPPPEPAGCPELLEVEAPTKLNDRAEKIAWQKCLDNRRFKWICEKDERSLTGYSRSYLCHQFDDTQRIATDNVAESAAQPTEFPHMAVLGCNNKEKSNGQGSEPDIIWIGGGSLISERYILTAGHVLWENTHGAIKYALLGVLNSTDIRNGELYYIVNRKPYPTYVSSEQHDDIALLELNRQVKFSQYIYPICLPVNDIIEGDGTLLIAGWGQTGQHRNKSQILLKANVYKMNCKTSQTSNSSTGNDSTIICARGRRPSNPDKEQYSDSCKGDSGGPLMVKMQDQNFACSYVIIGIVSRGEFCGTDNPGVYTRVFPYLKWIVDVVWPEKPAEVKSEDDDFLNF